RGGRSRRCSTPPRAARSSAPPSPRPAPAWSPGGRRAPRAASHGRPGDAQERSLGARTAGCQGPADLSQGGKPVATVTRDDAYEFEEKGFGWLLFAATMLGLAGILSIFNGIGALSKASFYSANAHYVFSDLRTWGWITLIVGILLIVAAIGVF